MENKIDQFFKDKLEGHALPPSEEAWTNIEANLPKKNNVAVWRIAAAILIAGALISVILWSQRADHDQPVIAGNHLPKDNSMKEKRAASNTLKEKKKEVSTLPQQSLITPGSKPIIQGKKNNKSVTTPELVPLEKKMVTSEESVATVEKNKSSLVITSEDKPEEKIKPEATPAATIASTRQKSIKLEFTLEDFSSAPPEATVEAKSSGLKKVWDVAREVKNGDRPVHEIKNELFALSFKKNKNQ